MGSYERSGIVVDQCTECRGIFLDRGELERFIDLAAGEVTPAPQPQWQTPPPDRAWRQQQVEQRPMAAPAGRHDWDHDSDSDSYRGSRSGHGGRPRSKRRKSILGELLDF
jgi:uncharacterized protein